MHTCAYVRIIFFGILLSYCPTVLWMMQRYKIFSPFPNISAIIFPFFLKNIVFGDMVSDVSYDFFFRSSVQLRRVHSRPNPHCRGHKSLGCGGWFRWHNRNSGMWNRPCSFDSQHRIWLSVAGSSLSPLRRAPSNSVTMFQ